MERIICRQNLAESYMKLVDQIPRGEQPVLDLPEFTKAIRNVKRALDAIAHAYGVPTETALEVAS